MSQKKILTGNIIMLVLAITAFAVMYFIPNKARRTEEAQKNYSRNAESKIDNQWAYFLINEEFPLEKDYTPELALVQGSFMMDERCAEYAKEMIAAAEKDGIYLTVVSAYRSTEKQQENLQAYINRLMAQGMNKEEAEAAALKEIAEPGESEHNAGVALDILTADWWETHDDVTADFENTEEYLWLCANAHKYGFILRYPKEWENVTGYTYEPWHYRFVGIYYAEEIKNSDLPFEYYYKLNF